jgi:NAD(P)-dependent dehydrogenase (short-subunit alcohol dehydrogenase family)
MNEDFFPTARQTVVITGGNQGLGYACAETLANADQNWCVVIAGHDRDHIAAAAEKLRQTSRAQVEPMLLNLASLRSIRYFSENLSEKLRDGCIPPLRALVCNAGVHPASGIAYTADGFEQTFAVNHLGHFLLVNLLLCQMTPPGRIVIVGGGTLNPLNAGRIFNPGRGFEARRLARPESPGGWHLSGSHRYRTSKFCNLLFACELNRRLAEAPAGTGLSGIAVNVFDPSVTPGTGLTRSWSGLPQRLWQSKTLHSVARCLGAKIFTVGNSGRAMAGLILKPELQGVSGKYFQVLNERPPWDMACNPALAKKLWEDSAELAGWNRKPADLFVDTPALLRMEPIPFNTVSRANSSPA